MERLLHTHSDDTSELLSAYSDDAVDVVDRRRAEDFAQSCPACAQELRELRLFKQVMHELPKVQPRRSFTLDPVTAPRPRWMLFPTLRLASLLTTVLLLVVLGVDGLSSGSLAPTADNATSAMLSYDGDQQAGGAAAGTGAAASTAALPQAAQAPQAASAAASAGADAFTKDAPATEASAAAAASVETAAQAAGAASTAAGGEGTTAGTAPGGAGAPNPAPMPSMVALNTDATNPPSSAASSNPEEQLAADSAAQSQSAPAAAGAATERELRANPASGINTETYGDVTQQTTNGQSSSIDTLLIVELLLGATAIAFGIGAFIAWRRRL